MAFTRNYDNSNEVRTEVVSVTVNRRGDTIKVATIQKDDNTSIDIRRWYLDDKDNEMPTTKGIRLSDELAVDVTAGLIMALSTEQMMDLADILGRNGITLEFDSADEEGYDGDITEINDDGEDSVEEPEYNDGEDGQAL